jgi:hypothetical protein
MIQGIVTRMASHSFALKGWTVTLVASIFTLTGKDVEKVYFLVVYLPIIVFWGLDSYYLMQGRLFRALYDKVRELPPEKIDFSMRASPQEFNSKKNSFCSCFFSKTEIWFYLPLALISTGIIVVSCMQ